MKAAYFDCSSGISGDMCLGALVGAGVPLGGLKRELKKAPIGGYAVSARDVSRAGQEALKVTVKVAASTAKARRYADVSGIINRSGLSTYVKNSGLKIFRALFEAEAKVHGGKYAEVHLHELGAVDALVDVLGTLICLELLGVEKVMASPVDLGWGTVRSEHGELPIPAPATAELVKGMPVYSSGRPYEMTTPTGAAILKCLASGFGEMPLMRLDAVGAGAGGRDIKGWPNALRVFIGETTSHEDGVVVIETNIDDMDPRLYGPVMEKLFRAGALDVFLTNIMMKKGRPGVKLTVLCDEGKRQALSGIILRETTTLGVRHYRAGRTVLERTIKKVATKYGPVRVKSAVIEGAVKSMPEYDDLVRAAKKHGVAVAEVAAEAARKAMETGL